MSRRRRQTENLPMQEHEPIQIVRRDWACLSFYTARVNQRRQVDEMEIRLLCECGNPNKVSLVPF